MLVERDEEIARLTQLFAGGPDEAGGGLGVISGAVASGKTELLNKVSDIAVARGVRLLSAVACASEQEFPYAVLEQLLRGVPPRLLGPDLDGAALGEPGQAPLGVLQGFHRALTELAASGPLLIAIDDVQFTDPQSLQCLAYAVRRCRGVALTTLVTHRPRSGPTASTALYELLQQRPVCQVRLGPLSLAGVGRLLTEELGVAEARRHAAAFHAATGGNPLLLRGLLEDHLSRRAHGRGPYENHVSHASHVNSADDVNDADDAGGPLIGELFRQATLSCLHRWGGAEELRIAHGVALLGDATSPQLLSRLVGVEERVVRQSVATLGELGILQGTGFRHPQVRSVLLDDLPCAELGRLHRRAAQLLHEEDADPTEVAQQLLSHEAAAPDEEWVPQVLREAARLALAEDRTEFAVRCLQLAKRCCTDEQESLIIQATLADALWRVKPLTQVRRLQSLAAPAREGLLPPRHTLRVAVGLMRIGSLDDAAAAIGQVSETLGDTPGSELDAELRVIGLALSCTYPGTPELRRFQEVWGTAESEGHPLDLGLDVPGRGPALSAAEAPGIAALTALRGVLKDGADASAVQAAERVLESTRLGERTAYALRAALRTLIYADRLTAAATWCDRVLAEAARCSTQAWLAGFSAIRGQIALRGGRLNDAVRYAEGALEQLPARGWGVVVGMPLAVLIHARTAMGQHDAAGELLARPVPEALFQTRFGLHYLHARGMHQLATGRHHAALTDLRACGEKMTGWGLDSPSVVPWRLGMAETWLALGNREKAARLAQEQLDLAHPSLPRTRGSALRVLAATRPVTEQPALLKEALDLLQSGDSWYGMARTMAQLAEAYKQLGESDKSRLMTRRAWRLADGCGAEELSRSLQRTPGRTATADGASAAAGPAGEPVAGFSSLSDAERRVAALAASGYTNREIAAKLFITISTVEQHLTRVYRKINITHRQDLPASLGCDVAHTA
ncbi:LuxR C-terminal-related transcriptional regulator [Streptomyces sp. LX-29]|uniref:helix-turn-helix transcriptional regulator n=1 Tax=Streptomyces sp. LX-29 TaxID=2900152 RepID=UPI00240CFE3B|nr:LuxR family transcriptional regulator [Streptomyces sp. LX-29]WFB09525.1 LuxR C-terminal-related transcriptional regulator [Streptomyces sp. LX-29]